MKLTFTNIGEPVQQQDIDRKSQDMGGIILPEDYQRFLLKQNGGEPKPNYFYIKDESETELSLKLREIKKLYSLAEIQISEEDTPQEFILIGESDNDTIVLGHSTPYENQVFYWCYDEMPDYDDDDNLPSPTMDNMYWVADTFAHFLNILTEDPDETELDRMFDEEDIQGLIKYFESPRYDPIKTSDHGQGDLRRVTYSLGSVELFKVFVAKGVDPLQNEAIWHIAARDNRVNLLRYLLDQGSTMGRDFGGLFVAALEGSLDSFKFILSLGADPTEMPEGEDKTLLEILGFRMNHPTHYDKREVLHEIYAILEPYFQEKTEI
jgi:hypothetical protein